MAENDAGRIVGFAIAGRQRRQGVLVGRLITIDVDGAWRRRGVGHGLLEEIETEFRGMGVVAVLLEVAVDNTAAQELYVRHGFAPHGADPAAIIWAASMRWRWKSISWSDAGAQVQSGLGYATTMRTMLSGGKLRAGSWP